MASNIGDNGEDVTLKIEAEEVIKEVSFAVSSVALSEKIPSKNDSVFMNLVTKENDTYCVELSIKGFQVVSKNFDNIDESVKEKSRYFETIYALLDTLSPDYRSTFSDTLINKLNKIKDSELNGLQIEES